MSGKFADRLLGSFHKGYFALTSLRPLGAIDWAWRRMLGRWLNDATTATDIEMIRCLGKYREEDCANYYRSCESGPPEFPNIEVAVFSGKPDLPLERLISALGEQDYPLEKVALTVITFESSGTFDQTDFPVGFRSIRVESIPESETNRCCREIIDRTDSSLVMLISHFRIPGPACLRRAITWARQDSAQVAAWDLSPTPAERTRYCDPVTLEVPYSRMALSLVRPAAIKDAGGFDDRLPLTGQGLELSYRLRQRGYRLRCIGRRSDFADNPQSLRPATETAGASTLFALRSLYGSWLLRILNPMLFNLQRQSSSSSRAKAHRPKGAKPARAQVPTICAVPSRLWSGEYEIGMGNPGPKAAGSDFDPPLVSIVVRTYAGRGAWLRQSTRSALNQTYDRLQLVVVEDGSEEHRGYIEDLQSSLAETRSVTYLSQNKLGKSAAGNRGLEAASGQYIGFLDDDDLLMPDHVEALHQAIRSEDGTAGGYALAWDAHTELLDPDGYREIYMEVPRHYRTDFDYEKLTHLNYLPIQSVLFDRRLYETYGGFENNRQYLEDWDLWLRYTRNERFVHLPRITSIYRTPGDPYARIARVRNSERRAAPSA